MTVDAFGIPLDGLEEVLRGWSGRGQLYEALAVPNPDDEFHWSQQDVEGRANRVMLTRLEPLLLGWPTSSADWLHALPAQSLRQRRISDAPTAGTDWVETRILGWPPDQFVVHDRSRIADQLMATTLRWTIDRVVDIRRSARRVERTTENIAQHQIRAAMSLLSEPPLDSSEAVAPARPDIRALTRSGSPWTKLAPVAEMLLAARSENLLTFALQHLVPDEDLRPRIFHLAVLGMLLKTLRERGARITSLRPLSGAASPGPTYGVELNGRHWDLWFEAGAIWGHYGKEAPYPKLARSAIEYQASPLSPDILLIAPGEDAYSFECKYGQREYIAHQGYLQAVAYGYELRSCHAPCVTSCAVGPDPKVVRDQWFTAHDVTIGMIGPRHIKTMTF